MTNVITRFAPSPTGFLHIGSARTALFNYLFARHHNGKFLLRIEDTDKERSTNEAVEAIFSGLKWLGLDWDGEVIFQSKRNDLYKEAALKLLQAGKAYYCFTSQEEIEKQRQKALENKQHFIFNSEWRDKDTAAYPTDVKPVIRLKTPREGSIAIRDTLQGDVVIKNSHIDDMVLLRSDGTATYMLAVVVDDHDMGITHIIRGDDHLTNAARQIAIYQAYGYEVPSMTHIPLIHGADGAKLSKRHGALGVEAYKDMGYLPESLCNYLLRLGWSHGDDEIIAMDQAIKWFNLDSLGKSPAKLDFAKINSLNTHYLRLLDNDSLTSKIVEILRQNYNVSKQEVIYINQAIQSLLVRSKTLLDLARIAQIYLVDSPIIYKQDVKEIIENCDKDLIKQVIENLNKLEHFDKESVQNKFKEIATHNGLKLNELMKPVRALITGMTASPSVFEIAEILGKENILKRLKII
ncbi:MAG: glutamate--tRNA ligase [Rickettsia endosymbiont of Ixodes persulcatus]|nr:glutamate--tRNA ligase [Rickettsia endosymbiont of Ixodes persulcatus]MCZ6901733.1 glutamate--tRNA ligase [Rickettsia endosymbiont of Ixodes persulcatus]MCZ6902967.1 glutamate--tRNA ligase [Rickettsia endosymbiont of Ixodes persulcatus]MCZ6908807.1 glutamate--tRNA ligase [Rickettsia endosymbiont of Ixodes persulcatus]MCZ6910884.1 glutamate--tRNA ligase [Rickettsia endosymbiont of Ixodes persulcatus]